VAETGRAKEPIQGIGEGGRCKKGQGGSIALLYLTSSGNRGEANVEEERGKKVRGEKKGHGLNVNGMEMLVYNGCIQYI